MKIDLFEHEPADVRIRCDYCGYEHKILISPVMTEVLQIDLWADNYSAQVYRGAEPEGVHKMNNSDNGED